MDERTERTISLLKNWKDLSIFEANARRLGRLTDEVVDAINARAAEIGRGYISEKTGLELRDLTPAEEKIVQAVSEYVAILRRKNKYPTRTLSQISNLGLIGAAETSVCKATPTQGFQSLADESLEELSYEQIILDHEDEFSARAAWYSRKRLGLENNSDKPPADTNSATQIRTVVLLDWLQENAEANGGILPNYTNTDVAAILDMHDMHKYGRVLGNIQSRIDYACYICNLPPLGLSAEAPFDKAWSKEDREWAFPVDEMQVAAQSSTWRQKDFECVLRETEKLPGQAHIVWNKEITGNETLVKEWAFSFSSAQPLSGEAEKEKATAKRNPAWSRDELILALELYLQHRSAPPGKDSAEVGALSVLLNKMGQILGLGNEETYRNANGVYMKMMNFRRFDTEYTKDGRVGLTRGNKDEEVVWNDFSSEPERLSVVAAAIRAAVEQHEADHVLEGLEEPDIQEAEEGRVLTRLHRVRERSRKLVAAKKKDALSKYAQLACEACGLVLAHKYGYAGEGIIDVHHTKPVHTLAEGETTKLEDLALLCANCHRVVHSTRKWLSVEQVKELIATNKRTDASQQ